MFGLIFIVTAVISVISSKELLDIVIDNNLQHETGQTNKGKLLGPDEVAALREMVLKQGQEISGLKLKQEQELSGLKKEIFLINK